MGLGHSMSCRLARLTHRPVSRLVPPFRLAARSAMWRLVPRLALSSCSSSRSYRSASRSSVSSCRLVLYRAALVVSLLSSREAGAVLRGALSVVLLYSPRSCVVLILYRAALSSRPSRLAMR